MNREECSILDSAPNTGQELELSHCWNRTGVYGDGTCNELPRYTHCRNCPVYSAAGLQLLNRQLPEGYRQECTAHFATTRTQRAGSTASAVVFRVATDWFALPTQVLQEVAERRRLHSLPHRRNGLVMGLANVRGELLVCISLAQFLGLEDAGSRERLYATYHRLLAANWEGDRFAFPVHEVYGPHRFQFQEMKSTVRSVTISKPIYTQNVIYWQQRAVGLLNPALLFPNLNRSLM